MKKKSRIEKFLALSPAERRTATALFDQEYIAETARSLTPTERKQWAKAKRGRGRPK